VLPVDSSYIHAIATTPARPIEPCRSWLNQQRPSPSVEQVGSRIARFEVCSAFTRVLACLLADSPKEPFPEVLQSQSLPPGTAPGATGWSDQLPGGIRTRWNQHAFSRHTDRSELCKGGLPIRSMWLKQARAPSQPSGDCPTSQVVGVRKTSFSNGYPVV